MSLKNLKVLWASEFNVRQVGKKLKPAGRGHARDQALHLLLPGPWRRELLLGPPVVPFLSPFLVGRVPLLEKTKPKEETVQVLQYFWGEGSPTQIDYRKTYGTLIFQPLGTKVEGKDG